MHEPLIRPNLILSIVNLSRLVAPHGSTPAACPLREQGRASRVKVNGDLIRPTKASRGGTSSSRPVCVYGEPGHRRLACLPGHTPSVRRAD